MKHLRRRWIVLTPLFTFFAAGADADEYYPFYSIECNEQLGSLKIEAVGAWNIGDIFWPRVELPTDRDARARLWQAHEAALERIETEKGLYVFGEPGGRYAEAPVVCELGAIVVEITAPKVQREPYMEGDVAEFYRGLPTVTLKEWGKVLGQWVLTYRDKLTIDVNQASYDLTLTSCLAGSECELPVAPMITGR